MHVTVPECMLPTGNWWHSFPEYCKWCYIVEKYMINILPILCRKTDHVDIKSIMGYFYKESHFSACSWLLWAYIKLLKKKRWDQAKKCLFSNRNRGNRNILKFWSHTNVDCFWKIPRVGNKAGSIRSNGY